MRIAVHTHYTNSWEELAAIVIPNLQRYADKHGYDLHIEKYPDGNVNFVKTKTALKLLKDYDLVFCCEADILIIDHRIKIENFVDDNHSFFICKDINDYNGGSFIVKNNGYGEVFLENTNNSKYGFETEQNYWEANCYNHPDVKTLPHPSINSIPYDIYGKSFGKIGYTEGDIIEKPTLEQGNYEDGKCFLCHLPGTTLNFRINYFNELKQHIIYE